MSRPFSKGSGNEATAMSASVFSMAFSPLLPPILLAVLAVLALIGVAFGLARKARGIWWRGLALGVLLLALLNPSLKDEQREPLTDIALVVVDDSPSQNIGDRRAQSEAALTELREKLAAVPDLETRVIRAGRAESRAAGAAPVDGTHLFEAINRSLADVPPQRLAGVIMITDGQVHDVPENPAENAPHAPLHVLLTGDRDARDRRLVVEQAPSYGIVGSRVTMTVRIEDLPAAASPGTARLTIVRDGGDRRVLDVRTGEKYSFEVSVDHGGPNVFEIEAAPIEGEITAQNNRAAVVVNGVRDRLRVLLVSGVPHNGERVWRNLLKSDPSVDLVHFTILRPPEKQDGTPVRELSLIAFPTRELFEEKLSDFDLIIFDRYHRRGILANAYLQNIARFVQDGGAVLEAGGPSYASPFGLFRTPLGEIMPVVPTGEVVEQGYRPTVSAVGRRHPVTADLEGAGKPAAEGQPATPPTWGRWFNITEGDARRGEVLMEGPGGRPLLVLDRVGKGRVAQIMSDQIWLWGRGFDGGGPQAELLRRISHWLMKEPELEEDDLRAVARGSEIQITRHSLKVDESPVTVRSPSGEEQSLTLADQGDGRAVATFHASEQGLHRISDERHTVYAVAGTLNPLEFADVRSTPEKLEPVIKAQGGSANWLADGRVPDIRRVAPERTVAGRGWIGLRANGDYIVRGVTEIPLLPALATLALAIGTLLFAWRREGR
jgi:hypothetical protein